MSYCPLLLSLLLLSDSFNFGTTADADGEQAQRVYGQPGGDRLPAQEKRGDLNKADDGQNGSGAQVFADYLNCINMHLEKIFFFNHSLGGFHACLCYSDK